jgi:pantothenate kinase
MCDAGLPACSGIAFLLKNKVPDEIYSVSTKRSDELRRASEVPFIARPAHIPEDQLFPLLLCNVGSGVSVVKVTQRRACRKASSACLAYALMAQSRFRLNDSRYPFFRFALRSK